MAPTSLSLLERLQRRPLGDDWGRFVDIYRPFVVRFIRLDGAAGADAEDVCQDVMRKVVEHLPNFRRQRDGSFRKWLQTVTLNQVNDYLRRRGRDGRIEAGVEHPALAGMFDSRDDLRQMWDREHDDHVLRRLLEVVEPDFASSTWQAFRLRVLEERPSKEVASILGISPNAVDIAKSRVLQRLRDEAAGLLDD